jgi:hypothetical protein
MATDTTKIISTSTALGTEIANAIKSLDATIAALDSRVTALETSTPVEPPVEPPIEPPVEPPTGDFVYNGLNTVWPKAATTGPRVALTNDSRTSFSRAETVTGKRFNASVRITVDGMKFVDCEFNTKGAAWGIDVESKRVTLEYCRLKGTGGEAGLLGIPEKLHRCDISGYKDGLKPQGSNLVITENFIHDPHITADSHNDGIQAMDRMDNVLIQGNYIAWHDTSEVFSASQNGACTNFTTKWNWLGGSDMPIRYENTHGHNGGTGKIIENVIKEGNWGYIDCANCSPEVRGNIDATSGAQISQNREAAPAAYSK